MFLEEMQGSEILLPILVGHAKTNFCFYHILIYLQYYSKIFIFNSPKEYLPGLTARWLKTHKIKKVDVCQCKMRNKQI